MAQLEKPVVKVRPHRRTVPPNEGDPSLLRTLGLSPSQLHSRLAPATDHPAASSLHGQKFRKQSAPLNLPHSIIRCADGELYVLSDYVAGVGRAAVVKACVNARTGAVAVAKVVHFRDASLEAGNPDDRKAGRSGGGTASPGVDAHLLAMY